MHLCVCLRSFTYDMCKLSMKMLLNVAIFIWQGLKQLHALGQEAANTMDAWDR